MCTTECARGAVLAVPALVAAVLRLRDWCRRRARPCASRVRACAVRNPESASEAPLRPGPTRASRRGGQADADRRPARSAGRAVGCQAPARTRAHRRPSAPWRIGSSMNATTAPRRRCSRPPAARRAAGSTPRRAVGRGQHDDREVPEVDAVGAHADPAQRPASRAPGPSRRGRVRERRDHQHGRHRQQHQAAAGRGTASTRWCARSAAR